MKFALLGIDPEALRLVRAIVANGAHTLAWFSFSVAEEQPPVSSHELALAEELRRLAPPAAESSDWTEVFGSRAADVVIVAGGVSPGSRFGHLRKLVQEQVPVIVTQPVTFSVLEAYELEMVAQESNGVIVPLLTNRWLPKTRWLCRAIAAGRAAATVPLDGDLGRIGRVEQIVMERQQPDRSRAAVLGQFSRDVDFIRAMCGEITQVAGLGPPVAPGSGTPVDLAALGVQMTGPAGILVRWSIEQPTGEPGSRITVVGQAGRITLDMPDAQDSQDWALEQLVQGPGTSKQLASVRLPSETTNLADLAAARVASALQTGQTAANVGSAASSANPLEATWSDVTRSLELTEALEKSLRKGRTVALSFEGRGETNAFKGTMASVGCGLLVMGFLVTIVVAVVSKLAEATGNQAAAAVFRWWPKALLVLLALFLLLQLLRFIIPEGDSKNSSKKEQ